MPANFWESFGYGLGRGLLRAYLDVWKEVDTAVEEAPNEKDAETARRARDAIYRFLHPSDNHDPGSDGSSSSG